MGQKVGLLRRIRARLDRNKLGEILVLEGIITADQLRLHLKAQKEAGLKLGQYLVQNRIISRRQLAGALIAQSGLRSMAAGVAVFASLSAISLRSAYAGASIGDVPAQLTLVSASSHFGSVSRYPALFGSAEKSSRDISAFTKWSDMFARFEQEMMSGNGGVVLASWKHELEPLQGKSLRSMAQAVNKMVNATKYVPDTRNYKKTDYWATPVEFFTKGGDCEDYAIAKYTSLRMLGVPESRMRIAIVQDMVKRVPHAILVVYGDDGTYILDNQSEAMKYAENVTSYKPIFSINRTGWWLHKAPATTLIASR
ncbi:MAG: transglutaminase-like cysteine peptidase [Pseudobdellovibrionaceae bacterium]